MRLDANVVVSLCGVQCVICLTECATSADWTTNVLWDQSAVEDKYGRLKPSRVDGGYHGEACILSSTLDVPLPLPLPHPRSTLRSDAACWWFKENGTFQLVSRADVGFGTGISVVYKSEIKKYTAVEEPPELPPWPGAAAASLIRRRTISR